MRVMIAAGGTGGHIYPGIAVAQEIKRRDQRNELLFVGSERGLEKRLVPQAGFDLSLIESAGLKNVGFSGKVRGLLLLPKSFLAARRVLRQFAPDVVVGAGGYVSGPVLLTAWMMRFRTLVMDSNALPGFTNRVLARFVDRAALTFAAAQRYFPRTGFVTGNPVRSTFFAVEPAQRDGTFRVLIFGGSQGARGINRAMIKALPALASIKDGLRLVHQTGEADFAEVSKAYADAGWDPTAVCRYIDDMAVAFAGADLIICRAGATTCAEIAAAGKAALMIPLPTAADNHQRKNAEALQESGAARMILQADLTGERLAGEVISLARSPETLTAMETASRQLGRPDAASSIVDLIEELAVRSKAKAVAA